MCRKTLLGLAIGLVTVTMFFVGCDRTKKEATQSGDPRYPITISIFTSDAAQQPNRDNKIYKYLNEKLNVTFTWDILVGEIAQKRGIMIAGGDYPDIVAADDAFIDAGTFIPLDDLVDRYGPRIKEHFGDVWDKQRSADGNVYYLTTWGVFTGRDQSPYYGDSAMWIQKEILKEAGYPKIVTLDQYFDLIINYSKKHPTINGQPVVPFTILTYDWHAFCLWNPPNFLAGYPNEGNGTVDPVTHEYKNFFTQDISKRWFKKLNELNAQGYVDRSAFTENYDQYLAKLATGRVLGIHDQRWQFANAMDALRDQGMYNRTMAPLPIVYNETTRPRYRNRTIPNLGRGMGISIKAKDPVRIMRFLNDFMAEEIQRTMSWGIEGEDWQWNDKHEPYRTQEQRTNWNNQAWQEQNRAILARNIFPTWEGSFTDGYPTELENYYPEREANAREEDKELWAAYGVTSDAELMDKDPPPNSLWFPTWNMPAPPDGSEAQIAYQRCELSMKKYLPQIILANPLDFEGLWAEYVDEMNKNGIAKYETYMQEQLNRRIEEWSEN
jgi:putative aldouronate transport system substrate-binding protein